MLKRQFGNVLLLRSVGKDAHLDELNEVATFEVARIAE